MPPFVTKPIDAATADQLADAAYNLIGAMEMLLWETGYDGGDGSYDEAIEGAKDAIRHAITAGNEHQPQ